MGIGGGGDGITPGYGKKPREKKRGAHFRGGGERFTPRPGGSGRGEMERLGVMRKVGVFTPPRAPILGRFPGVLRPCTPPKMERGGNPGGQRVSQGVGGWVGGL